MDQTPTFPNIALCPCDSSQIHAHGYDPATGTLLLQFKRSVDGQRVGGNVYQYTGVPPELYDGFQKAESKGTFFGEHIKPEHKKYPFTKLGLPPAPEVA